MTNFDETPVFISDLVDFVICCLAMKSSKEKAKEILNRNPKLKEFVREFVEKNEN